MADVKISAQANHVTSFTNKPRFPVADDPTGTPVSGYMDTDDISTIADASAAAAIAALTIGDVLGTATADDGEVVLFDGSGYKLKSSGAAMPDISLLVTGDASVTPGNIAVFDADGYHIVDGGAISSTPSIEILATQFDKTNNTYSIISELSIDVVSGNTYIFRGVLQTTSESAAGINITLGGTCTSSTLFYTLALLDSSTITYLNSSASIFESGVISSNGLTAALIYIDGSITVTGDGAIYPMFSQAVTNVLPSSVLVGSYFKVELVV
jgi:hypothetical protein